MSSKFGIYTNVYPKPKANAVNIVTYEISFIFSIFSPLGVYENSRSPDLWPTYSLRLPGKLNPVVLAAFVAKYSSGAVADSNRFPLAITILL
jgi:hypothetical protein